MSLPEWSGKEPATLPDLFSFYHDYVKPLYGLVQSEGALPQEMLFEINAALDHISRIWIYEEDEEKAVQKAFGHFKRSCLDAFKILVKEAKDQYNEITAIDTSRLDNGQFDKALHELWRDIKVRAMEARRIEGKPGGDRVPAFDKWEEVATACLRLQNEFLFHDHIEWARRRSTIETWGMKARRWAEGMVLTFVIYVFVAPDRLTVAFGSFVGLLVLLAWIGPYAAKKACDTLCRKRECRRSHFAR